MNRGGRRRKRRDHAHSALAPPSPATHRVPLHRQLAVSCEWEGWGGTVWRVCERGACGRGAKAARGQHRRRRKGMDRAKERARCSHPFSARHRSPSWRRRARHSNLCHPCCAGRVGGPACGRSPWWEEEGREEGGAQAGGAQNRQKKGRGAEGYGRARACACARGRDSRVRVARVWAGAGAADARVWIGRARGAQSMVKKRVGEKGGGPFFLSPVRALQHSRHLSAAPALRSGRPRPPACIFSPAGPPLTPCLLTITPGWCLPSPRRRGAWRTPPTRRRRLPRRANGAGN